MPTFLSHPAVPLAIGLGLGSKVIPSRLLMAGIALSVLPDLDVLAFRFGVSYASDIGHRGFSHSLIFAALAALLGTSCFRKRLAMAFWFLFAAAASHGLLDAFTNGGLGIAFLWPFSTARFFAPIQVIEVSPLSIQRFLSPRGETILMSEITWVWLPCVIIGIFMGVIRWRLVKRKVEKLGPIIS